MREPSGPSGLATVVRRPPAVGLRLSWLGLSWSDIGLARVVCPFGTPLRGTPIHVFFGHSLHDFVLRVQWLCSGRVFGLAGHNQSPTSLAKLLPSSLCFDLRSFHRFPQFPYVVLVKREFDTLVPHAVEILNA